MIELVEEDLTISPVPGYESLQAVLRDAYNQAAVGKGAERHANSLPFHEQPMQSISELFDSPFGMAFQVAKKLKEGISMPEFERQKRELLGAIVYTAGIIIYLEKQRDTRDFPEVKNPTPDDTPIGSLEKPDRKWTEWFTRLPGGPIPTLNDDTVVRYRRRESTFTFTHKFGNITWDCPKLGHIVRYRVHIG